jgi:hypothetical protein
MTRLLFLDIDGVLNAHEYDPDVLCGQIHRDKVQLLNGVLRATGARLVLSSAWRYIVHRGEANLAGMEWLLRSHGILAGRLAGITPPDTMIPADMGFDGKWWPAEMERGTQIAAFLARHGPHDGYAVVDDMDLGITAAGHPFVQTDGLTGLTPDDAAKLVELLLRPTPPA